MSNLYIYIYFFIDFSPFTLGDCFTPSKRFSTDKKKYLWLIFMIIVFPIFHKDFSMTLINFGFLAKKTLWWIKKSISTLEGNHKVVFKIIRKF